MTLTREEAAALAAAHGLERVDQAADFSQYLRDCWRLRHFTWNFSIARTIVATVQNNLGLLWEVITPLLLSVTYYLAFGVLLGTRQDSPDFITFLICGVFTWRLFNQGLMAVSASLNKSKDLTQSLLFPRVLVPIAATIQAFISSLPSMLLLYPIALFAGAKPNWYWLLLPFNFLLTALFTLGCGFFLTRMIAAVRDVGQMLPLGFRVLMFASGVFYDIKKRFATAPDTIRALAEYNPAGILLNNTRAVFIDNAGPTQHEMIWVISITVVLVLSGFVVFWRSERLNG